MLPIKLTIEGLYSYKEQQIIDFEPLLSNQLFGIFGEVGSGKSTILEAIIYALFDASDRLKKSGDNRAYNMMNLQSNRMLIDFECWAGQSGKEQYRFTVETKRNSKRFEEVRTPKRSVSKWVNGNWEALEHPKVDEIIGMNAKNFRQTVIIPQGKFQNFIQQKPTERTEMLQELFQLHQFDLAYPTKRLVAQNNTKIAETTALYERLAEVTTEKSKLLTEEIKASKVQKTTLATSIKETQASLQGLELLLGQAQELKRVQQQYKQLIQQKEDIKLRQDQLQAYQKASMHFKDKLAMLKELKQELATHEKIIKGLEQEISKLQATKKVQAQTLEEAKAAYQKKDEIRQNCDDLEHLIQIKKTEAERLTLANKQKSLTLALEKNELRVHTAAEEVVKLSKEIKLATDGLGDIVALKDVESLLKEIAQGEKERHSAQEQVQKATETMQVLAKEKIALEEAFRQDYGAIIDISEQELEEVELKWRKLQAKSTFAQEAAQLNTGDPCPLCGAMDHPHLAHDPSVQQEMNELEKARKGLQVKQKRYQQLQLKLNGIQIKQEQEAKNLTSYTEQVAHLTARVNALVAKQQVLPNSELTLAEVSTTIRHYKQVKQRLEQEEVRLENLRKEVEQLRKKGEEQQQEVQQITTEFTTLDASKNTHLASLKNLSYEKFSTYTLAQLDTSWQKGKAKLESVTIHYEKSQKTFDTLSSNLNTNEGKLQSSQQTGQQLASRHERLLEQIEQALQKTDFPDVTKVENLLKLELNVAQEQQEIDAFYDQLKKVEAKQEELAKKMQGQSVTVASVESSRKSLKQLQKQQEEVIQQLARATQSLEKNKAALAEKRALKKALEELELRKVNLKVFVDRLFKGKGFVEYVSTVYLQNLVWAANERFMKLTKNKMSVELDEHNEFVIRDFLNGGKTRALKTLSGGQTFQVALCLALALAENVKSLNQAEQSFFFLDEGFGTLDKKSLQIVFETLKALQQEKRIVGIISHVEELKQEIDVALLIEQDPDRGSLIRQSWK